MLNCGAYFYHHKMLCYIWVIQNIPEHMFFISGRPCLSLYSADNCFYRAYILKVISGVSGTQIVGVHYVDYGNTEYVTVDK